MIRYDSELITTYTHNMFELRYLLMNNFTKKNDRQIEKLIKQQIDVLKLMCDHEINNNRFL